MNLDKMRYIIYADIESLIGKIDGWANNPENYSTRKIGEHVSCGFSMSTIWGFDHIDDKHTLYSGKDCMKKFCTSLREHGKKRKEKNVSVTRKGIKITSRCKSMLYLLKKKS